MIMEKRVRVYGKTNARTALGIAHAYLIMYPHATLDDFNKAFPKKLNSTFPSETLFIDTKNANKFSGTTTQALFYKSDEVLNLKDGTKVTMPYFWTDSDFENFVNHAAQYGIEIASFEKRQTCKKGEYRLEYLNGYVPPISEKKKTKWWLWVLLAIFVICCAIVGVKLM